MEVTKSQTKIVLGCKNGALFQKKRSKFPKSNTVLMCMQEHNPDGSNHCFQKLN